MCGHLMPPREPIVQMAGWHLKAPATSVLTDLHTLLKLRHYCQQHGGSLIHVDSDTENDFIRNYLRGLSRSSGHQWWLGLTDELVEGHWRWTDVNKPATFLDWAPNEPNIAVEDCAAIIPLLDFHWADVLCDRLDIIPLCEIRLSEETVIVG
ncbi:perlucin-like protein isoform X2 [Dreissena polymorpha]|uniref:perlucin-like protein isoform X2 n=1 Tax=Dreissena polymorpha TaxID=45954 RepID=UPI002263D824|nr:perlucin-like protein isoform X2 [Dreissena polymorpha]